MQRSCAPRTAGDGCPQVLLGLAELEAGYESNCAARVLSATTAAFAAGLSAAFCYVLYLWKMGPAGMGQADRTGLLLAWSQRYHLALRFSGNARSCTHDFHSAG